MNETATLESVMQRVLDAISFAAMRADGAGVEPLSRAYLNLAHAAMAQRPFGSGKPSGLDSGIALEGR